MTILRKLRLFWTRYLVPSSLEQEPGFHETMSALTRRGLRLAGTLGIIGICLYLLGHLTAGKSFVWRLNELDTEGQVLLWNKALLLGLSMLLLAVARYRPGVRVGRLLMGLALVLASFALVQEGTIRGDFTFTAGWAALIMLVTVGTVPFQPWQTALVCLLIAFIYGFNANRAGAESLSAYVFLGLVTFMCTSMSASLYVSRYEQYRALRRVERFKANLSAKKEALQRALTRGQQMQTQLVKQEKLASLGQLTAGIAHEIKNPLNFVNNFAQLSGELMDELIEELNENPEKPVGEALKDVEDLFSDLKTNTEKISVHGLRADGIVKSMLAHSRKTPGDLQPVGLNKLVDEYVGLAYHGMRAQHNKFNVDIQRDFDDSVGEVELVREELGRVLLNLIDNAFDAVRAKSADSGDEYIPTVQVTTMATPSDVTVVITDNGVGIPEDLRERIFEPFFTTKPSGEGTGLGLSLAYDIITGVHGGEMDVLPGRDGGTTFTITLPRERSQVSEEITVE